MPALDLDTALADVRALLLDDQFVRAVAAGRRHGAPAPEPTRAEVRPVALRAGRHLQVTARTGPGVRIANHLEGEQAESAVGHLLALPFGNWHVQTTAEVLQVRVTKRGAAQLHRAAAPGAAAPGAAAPGAAGASVAPGADGSAAAPDQAGQACVVDLAGPAAGPADDVDRAETGDLMAQPASAGGPDQAEPAPAASAPAASAPAAEPGVALAHDRQKSHLLDPGDPLFTVLGADGDKRRQVDAFLRQLAQVVPGPSAAQHPLRAVDLGCGSASLTLAAHRWLAARPGGARTVGVELRPDLVTRSTERAARVGLEGLAFVAGTIEGADPTGQLGGPPDVVLALHACDTATDDALARAVRWGAPVVLAAPCCHHDVQRQLKGTAPPEPYGLLVRQPILRERFADVLTDALRAALLRLLGYRVDVVEFVGSAHTPRNALLRVVRTGAPPTDAQLGEYRALTAAWGLRPALAERLAPELDAALAPTGT